MMALWTQEARVAERRWTIRQGDYGEIAGARRDFIAYLREHAQPESDFAAAELIFGELVTNAVRHAREAVIAEISLRAVPELRVRDDGEAPASLNIQPADSSATSGRGMYIVQSLAVDLRIEPAQAGLEVSVLLPVRLRATNHPKG